MRYLSLFSGIEATTQAWKQLGWECVGFSEIEPFPCAVLEHHYPDVPNLGDVTKITEEQVKELGYIDMIVFGSPCQNLSVAGIQEGLQGGQSSLFFTAMEIIRYARRNNGLRFALWENVLGSFSSNKGADFSTVVEQMAGLENIGVPKYGWGTEGVAVGSNGLLEWSVLDSQWFGLPQRRKRVFAILDFGDWESRPPILLEPERLRGDSPPSRETGEINTTTSSTSFGGGGEVTAIAGNIIGRSVTNGGNHTGYDDTGSCYTLTATDRHAVAYSCGAEGFVVRRLTPIEWERLQGFPDDYSKIPYRNKSAKDCPDGVRYKALGNSMAVPVMLWIGRKVEESLS